jgi:hypothetical protein
MYTLRTSLTADIRCFSTEEKALEAFRKERDKLRSRDIIGFVRVCCGMREVCSFSISE